MGCEPGNYRTASLHTFICGGCPTAEHFFYDKNYGYKSRDLCISLIVV